MRRLACLAILVTLSLTALAQEPVTLDQTQHPALLLKTNQPGLYLSAPAVSTEVSLQVRGIVARGLVRQRFENAAGRCVEAIYVFPLSEKATVDAMRMKVGVRTIAGEIKERQEAARVYEQAKSEGRKASLLEQHRPNLFTVSVASIADGETVEIELEYQEIVRYDGHFSLRLPLAIGPRFEPPSGNGFLPQIRHAAPSPKRNPVTIDIDLDAGLSLTSVVSPTHPIETTTLSGTRVSVKPRDVQIASDRDFELTWTPRLGSVPQSAAFSEVAGEHRYTLLMLFPPDVSKKAAAILARETIFILDTSGSMEGQSLEQAKKALLTAIERLRPSDHFNVIEFNSTAQRLFAASRRADADTIEIATDWVAARQSTGGTEMLSALQLALGGDEPAKGVRQVIFITDGQVGNEQEVFEFIRANLGGDRVFTVGIGNAPNTFFMSNAARAGRGTFTHIGNIEQVSERMTELFRKLESPVLSNLDLQLDAGVEAWPKQLPDLYAGEPLIVTMRGPSTARAAGQVVSPGWQGTFAAASEQTQSGIAKLWARQKIDAVRDSVFTGANADDVKKEIVTLALEHHLVTEHTSLVAVDTTPAGVDATSCTSELVPLNLPAGWGGIDGALPRTATNARLWMLIGGALLLAALLMRK